MADTTTPNIGLLIADLSDVYDFGAHVEANLTKIDTYIGLVKCTSITRPSTTYGGQGIYETDTKRVAVNTGTGGSPTWTYVTNQAYECTSSTRPTVNLVSGMLIHETDTNFVRVYTGSAWIDIASPNCTSSARPANPIAGDIAYETDTNRVIAYTGAAWRQVGSTVSTSGSRPANPLTGSQTFETDLLATAVYNGSGWQYVVGQAAATQALGGTTASVTFSSIPAYNKLRLEWRARLSAATDVDLEMQIDGDTAAHYLWAKMSASNGAQANGHATVLASFMKFGVAGGVTANHFASGSLTIAGWASSTGYMTFSGTSATFDGTGTDWAETYSGQFEAVGPHTSIKLLPASNSFAAGSEFSLYGLM